MEVRLDNLPSWIKRVIRDHQKSVAMYDLHQGGKSYTEIGHAYGCSPQNASIRIKRVSKWLQETQKPT